MRRSGNRGQSRKPGVSKRRAPHRKCATPKETAVLLSKVVILRELPMKNGPNHTPTEVPHLLRRARGQLSKLLGTYWFIPSLMCLAVIGLASAITYVDTNLHSSFDIPWIYINSPEGARSVLSTIAGSVITVAGVAFSITIVALTVTSTQHGPHVVSNLMRDRGNQVVLGTLTATFLYCLLILRTVHSGSDEFPLALSIVAAVLLALASIAMLIYFVHHTSNSLRVESLIERVTVDYHDSLERLYPEVIGKEAAKAVEENSELPPSMDESTPLYVQKKGICRFAATDSRKFDTECATRAVHGRVAYHGAPRHSFGESHIEERF